MINEIFPLSTLLLILRIGFNKFKSNTNFDLFGRRNEEKNLKSPQPLMTYLINVSTCI